MKKRYSAINQKLSDKGLKTADKILALDTVADEKHYFAARFVWEAWKSATDPEIKGEAFRRLLDLIEFGTAYEALPDVLTALRSDDSPTELRVRILRSVGKMCLFGDSPGFSIAGQAYYDLPKEVQRNIVDTIRNLAASSDPKMRAEASAIVQSQLSPTSKPGEGK
jgi:hypothetical protein